jgi:hypothetical protein
MNINANSHCLFSSAGYKKTHDTVANLVFTLELGVVTNILFSDRQE